MSKVFKKWPCPAFENLTDTQKVAFWQSGSRTRNSIIQDLQVSITQQHLHTEISSKKGKYLPISVWKEQGYKTDNIVKNCPRKWDDQLEENTYMLRVEEEIEDKIRKDVVDMLEGEKVKDKKFKLWKGASPSPLKMRQRSKEVNKGTKRHRSASPSSSSSSSSSSSNGSKKSTRSNKSKPPSTPAKQTPQSVKTARKEKSIKDKQDRIQKQQETQRLKLEARAKALNDKQFALAEKEKDKKVKAAEAEKASKERQMSFMYTWQPHAVTTAQLCFRVCPTLHVRMIPDITGEEKGSRGKKGC